MTRLAEQAVANLGALIYPFFLIYLNSRLPKPARPRPYHYVILLLNSLFFGSGSKYFCVDRKRNHDTLIVLS